MSRSKRNRSPRRRDVRGATPLLCRHKAQIALGWISNQAIVFVGSPPEFGDAERTFSWQLSFGRFRDRLDPKHIVPINPRRCVEYAWWWVLQHRPENFLTQNAAGRLDILPIAVRHHLRHKSQSVLQRLSR